MSERKLPDFIRGFVSYGQNIESPKSYMVWAAISMLSSALERRCYMDWAGERLYPNQYIIIVGPAGLSRKDWPVYQARHFLSQVGCTICASKITHEKLIVDLADAKSEYSGDGRVHTQNPLTVISPELAVFLKFQETELLATLTDLWQAKDDWDNGTIKRGYDAVPGPCLNIIGATAPEWLGKIFPSEAVGGGFTSRCLFVHEKRKGKTVGDYIPLSRELEAALIHDLREVKSITGEFTFAPEARAAYVEWYETYDRQIQETGRFPLDNPKLYSYVARRATHIKKLCMAITVSEANSLVITLDVWNRALKYLYAVERRMTDTFEHIGSNRSAVHLRYIWEMIQGNPAMTRSAVLAHLQQDLDLSELMNIERMLMAMKYITITQDDKDTYYHINVSINLPALPSYPV